MLYRSCYAYVNQALRSTDSKQCTLDKLALRAYVCTRALAAHLALWTQHYITEVSLVCEFFLCMASLVIVVQLIGLTCMLELNSALVAMFLVASPYSNTVHTS